MELGINLSFAVKRWPEPERWAWIVREELGLDLVQFSFDLLDPWWPAAERGAMARRVRRAVADHGLRLHSAQFGLAWYTFNGLLHPDPSGRAIAGEWWQRALETAAEIGDARRVLFAAREARVHPVTDDKVLAAWNGMAIAALALSLIHI